MLSTNAAEHATGAFSAFDDWSALVSNMPSVEQTAALSAAASPGDADAADAAAGTETDEPTKP